MLCVVTSAYADQQSTDIFVKFMYGTVALLILGFAGSVTFIVYKFNSNVETLFKTQEALRNELKEQRDELNSFKLTCKLNHLRGDGK